MLEIRPATADDASALCGLLGQLGYDLATEVVRDRLACLAETGCDPVLVAIGDDDALGLVALHWAPMLHLPDPVARITALVVSESARGRGVGRRLVEDGAALARAARCASLELTTGLQRADAHAFYEAIGFEAAALKFRRTL